MKIQSMKSLKKEMMAVARGEIKAPADARQTSYESIEAVVRLLTKENRMLLAAIDQQKPASVADLAKMVERAESNVSRTLSKLETLGFVHLLPGEGRAKVPEVLIHHLSMEMDLCSLQDKMQAA